MFHAIVAVICIIILIVLERWNTEKIKQEDDEQLTK